MRVVYGLKKEISFFPQKETTRIRDSN